MNRMTRKYNCFISTLIHNYKTDKEIQWFEELNHIKVTSKCNSVIKKVIYVLTRIITYYDYLIMLRHAHTHYYILYHIILHNMKRHFTMKYHNIFDHVMLCYIIMVHIGFDNII